MFLDIEPAKEPLPRKEFNRHLDALLETGQLNPDILPYMSAIQHTVINEVKKALVRAENKK